MANRWTTQFVNTFEKKEVQISCRFKVDPSNINGSGVSSLIGGGIANVFMHTTSSFVGDTHTNKVIDNISSTVGLVVGQVLSGTGITAGTTIASITSATAITTSVATTATNSSVTISNVAAGSPNPAAGLIFVNFQDNYNKYLVGNYQVISPMSGTDLTINSGTPLTIGNAYTITSLGTSTTANWQGAGLPVGITPSVGVTFIASATSGTGTGKVQTSTPSLVNGIEIVGFPNQTITSSAATVLGSTSGAYMVLQCITQNAVGLTGTTHTTTTVDSLSSNAGLVVGQAISGTGIPLGARIATLPTSTSLTLSAAATASASGVALSASPAFVLAAPVALSYVKLNFFTSNSFITQQGQ